MDRTKTFEVTFTRTVVEHHRFWLEADDAAQARSRFDDEIKHIDGDTVVTVDILDGPNDVEIVRAEPKK